MKIDKTCFDSAFLNMNYDEALFKSTLTEPVLRLYAWPDVLSVTLPKFRSVPEPLLCLDHSFRITGGGIVFHSPSDFLMTFVLPVSSRPSLKPLLLQVSSSVRDVFLKLGIGLEFSSQGESLKNIQFCHGYYSPYELYYQGSKVVGFALKATKSCVLIQIVCHVSSQFETFSQFSCYESYFSSGISFVNTLDLISAFESDLFL